MTAAFLKRATLIWMPGGDQNRFMKAIEGTGLTKDNITFNDEAIQTVINRYTREAGVRNLERELSSICRKVARKVVTDGNLLLDKIYHVDGEFTGWLDDDSRFAAMLSANC